MKKCVWILGLVAGTLLAPGTHGPALAQVQPPQIEEAAGVQPDAAEHPAAAKAGKGPGKGGKLEQPDAKQVLDALQRDLRGLLNWPLAVEILIAFLSALAVGAIFGYHPRRKVASLEEADQPKIFIMYAIVGAVVALIVKEYPSMSFVIFGIGGLFRFRTDVGPARDTGRLILVTCLGLCSGLGMYLIAILGTVVGWLLIYVLESRSTYKVTVKGVEIPVLSQAADAHREVLVENGFHVISEKKNIVKKSVSFVFNAPGAFDKDELEGLFKDIPPKLQGAVDWEST